MSKEIPGLPERPSAESPLRQIINFLSSMQLGIILLLVLAAVSMFATTRQYELAIEKVYTSTWFVGIMAFTALNLLLCTIRRIGPLSRQAMHPKRLATADEIGKMNVRRALKLKNDGNTALELASRVFRRNGLAVTVSEGEEGGVVFGERGKYGYFGSVVTHLSLLLLLFGAMYGALTSFEYINGGYTGTGFFVPSGNFRVDVTNVEMVLEQDPAVRPRVYSDVVVTSGQNEIAGGRIAINRPLRFDGITIYHYTFRYISELKISNIATGEEYTAKFLDNQRVSLGSPADFIQLMQFYPNFARLPDGSAYNRDYSPDNPLLLGVQVKDGRQADTLALVPGIPQTIETTAGEMEIVLTGFENAAVYTITRNLGRPYLFIGAVGMIIGLYMSFFLFPRRFWAVYDAGKSTLLIGGRGYRNRIGVEQIMDRIEAEMLGGEK